MDNNNTAAYNTATSSDESSHSRAGSVSTGYKRKRRKTSQDQAGGDGSDRERHQCPHCDRSFGRIEHMKRHATSHSDQRPFRCSTCSKSFHRQDTMQRHELIHKDTNDPKPKGARACNACAQAKVKCQGGQPCHRCDIKTLDCEYPDTQLRQGHSQEPQPQPQSLARPVDLYRHASLVPPSQPAVAAFPSSNGMWPPVDGTSPSQTWSPRPSLPVDLESPRTVYGQQLNQATRHLSFSSAVLRPTGLTPLTGTDPYHHLRNTSFSVNGSNNASVQGTSTSNWLETLLAPPSVKDVGTPGSGTSHKTIGMSETYLDGDGARLPKIGIQRRFNLRPSLPIPQAGLPYPPRISSTYGFPACFCQPDLAINPPERGFIDKDMYNHIRHSFDRTCGPSSSYLPAFEGPNYPSWDHLQTFVQIYLDEFQPIIPMLHLPTLRMHAVHWLLILALASMGCHLADMPEAGYCSLGLNEHLRRVINDVMETTDFDIDPVTLAQVRLLSGISMTYCGDERLERHGWRQHADVVKFCRTHWSDAHANPRNIGVNLQGEVDDQWRRWKDVESRRRTGYAIWMLDCMWSYGYQERNLLTLEDAKVPLPCQEVLWEAESALQWQHVMSYSNPMPSLESATHSIYVEKRVEPTMGEYARILLIHALYSSSWAVQAHFSNPLSHWTPRTTRQQLSTIPHFREPIYLPSEPSYSRWRNATCDCLDILHWRANAVTGAASGIEHPTLLHLHLARIVLLTPFRDIASLAFGLTRIHVDPTLPPRSSPADITAMLTTVRRWAEEDQCKARLAMYHAGVLFWHVRLYSAKAFYEPTAVMLAALALWAFGSFAPKSPLPVSNSPGLPVTPLYDPAAAAAAAAAAGGAATTTATAEDQASFPTSINIDRPADDEIVQMYIRRGDRMQALIVGVGDIRSAAGPVRVLGEGAKLVSSLANWGSSARVMRVLVELARLTREEELGALVAGGGAAAKSAAAGA